MPTDMFERITEQIIRHLRIKPKLIALDGTGFTNDYADKYYAQIRGKERKSFTKCHVVVDVDSRIILYSQSDKRSKTRLQNYAIAANKKFKEI